MIIMGGDPGLSGAIAFLDTETGGVEIFDMPKFTLTRNGKAKGDVNAVELARLVDFHKPDIAFIEGVGASPQMGTSSAFAFGKGFGILVGVVAANFVELVTPAPVVWKKVMRVTSDKDSSRARATAIFPKMSAMFARKMDDGRAEAALIAAYGRIALSRDT